LGHFLIPSNNYLIINTGAGEHTLTPPRTLPSIIYLVLRVFRRRKLLDQHHSTLHTWRKQLWWMLKY